MRFFNLLIGSTAIVSFIISLLNINKIVDGYSLLVLMPLIFFLIYIIVLIPIIKTKKIIITVYMYLVRSWIRMVVLPSVMILSGNYYGIPYAIPSNTSIPVAISLIIYELVVSSIFLLIISLRVKKVRIDGTSITMYGNKIVYAVFILLAAIVYLTIGRQNNLIQLFMISADSGVRYGDETNTMLVLATRIITVGVAFLFICLAYYFKRNYDKTKNKKYVNYAMIAAIMNIIIIVGERRSAILYSSFVSGYILIKMFPEFKKKILRTVIIAGGSVIILMSVYKFFNAFIYESYIESIRNSTIDLDWLSKTMQIYFGSPQNVAIAIDMKEAFNIPFSNLFFDFGRSTFGLSFLLKGQGVLTSAYYNLFIYSSEITVGHVIPSIGYGYLYFGYIFSPIIICINLWLSSRFETLFIKSRSYEAMYVWGYILIRLASVYASTPPLISGASITIFTHGLLYLVASLINGRYIRKNNIQQHKQFQGVELLDTNYKS